MNPECPAPGISWADPQEGQEDARVTKPNSDCSAGGLRRPAWGGEGIWEAAVNALGAGCWGGLGSAGQTGGLHPGHGRTPLGHPELPESGRKPVSESWPRQRHMRAWLLALAVAANGLRSHPGPASV